MRNASLASLRQYLIDEYETLLRSLTRKLGSRDLAEEALQDTFLKLGRLEELGEIRSPRAFLFRVALNVATDNRRREGRRATHAEIDAALEIADDKPDPARIAQARQEMELINAALAEMPSRRREIFLAAWAKDWPHHVIAAAFGLSVRTIDHELKRAREHCALRLKQAERRNFRLGREQTSKK